jgi:hypothetical protein
MKKQIERFSVRYSQLRSIQHEFVSLCKKLGLAQCFGEYVSNVVICSNMFPDSVNPLPFLAFYRYMLCPFMKYRFFI